MPDSLEDKLAALQEQIARAARKSGRSPEEILLLGVTKKVPLPVIEEAYRSGMKAFGESKVQELKAKVPRLPSAIHWHMIGHLQSNKARDAVQFAEFIHSVDSENIAAEINKWAQNFSKNQKVLIEVNVAGEANKFGVRPELLEQIASGVNAMPRLELHGLMGMAPYTDDPEKARPHFARLRNLRDRLESGLGYKLPVLSMGMSGDFLPAIEEGATIVRIGTALFGERKNPSSPL